MTENKTKKYIIWSVLALIALLLLSTVCTVVSVSKGFDSEGTDMEVKKEESFDSAEVTALDISLKVTSLVVEYGEFEIRTNNEDVEWEIDGGVLRIKENGITTPFGINESGYKLVLTVPEYTRFDSVKIVSNVGRVQINDLDTVDLDLNVRIGLTEINRISVSGAANVKGLAGQMVMNDSWFEKINYKMRVGHSELDLSVKTEAELNTFIGKLNTYMPGEIEDYRLTVTEGFGLVKSKQDIYTDNDASKPVVKIGIVVGKITATFEV